MAEPSEVTFGPLLLGSIAFMVLAGGSLVTFLVTYQRRLFQQRLRQQLAEAAHQQEVLLAIVEAQEDERKRIGQELHDGLGTTLAAVKLLVSQLDRPASRAEDAKERRQLMEELVSSAVQDVRTVSHDLYPAVLARHGLHEALQHLAEVSQVTGRVPVDLRVRSIPRLGLAQELALYRICQELLHNAWKHAQGATWVLLELQQQNGQLILTVEDDGCGFSTVTADAAPVRTGVGLRSIDVRVQMLGARWEQHSAPGQGVRTVIEMGALEDGLSSSSGRGSRK